MKKINLRKMSVALVLLSLGVARASSLTEKEILSRLNASFTDVKSLESEFTQEVESPYWGKKVSHGHMSISRPSQMRWDYLNTKENKNKKEIKSNQDKKNAELKPDKFFLADGKELKMYDPELDQLKVEAQPKTGDIPLGMSLLLGGQKPTDVFDIQVLKQEGNKVNLKLSPKKEQAGVTHIEMELELSQPIKILKTTIFDQVGNKNTMIFENIKQNQTIDSKRFEAKVPKNTVIIQGFSGSSFL